MAGIYKKVIEAIRPGIACHNRNNFLAERELSCPVPMEKSCQQLKISDKLPFIQVGQSFLIAIFVLCQNIFYFFITQLQRILMFFFK
ncbi:MAG: hypothetical protein AMJ60_11645 [Desulfobacterales bacterium SG8_35]|nr:MAG: hypothetical protein AMJ60_11645 [Desulfobacterales bacterium SG8_35]